MRVPHAETHCPSSAASGATCTARLVSDDYAFMNGFHEQPSVELHPLSPARTLAESVGISNYSWAVGLSKERAPSTSTFRAIAHPWTFNPLPLLQRPERSYDSAGFPR